MKYFIALLMILTSSTLLEAQEIVKLYEGKIPGSKIAPADYVEEAQVGNDKMTRISKVTVPTISVFLPAKEKATGTGVIVCPGGGYGMLSIDLEGYEVARKLNAAGIAAFILKYRLPSDAVMEDKSSGPLMDVQQAMYLVRKNSEKWNVKADRIGVMGFSAGGHLASSLAVHYADAKIPNKENVSLRPDFSVLIYPVISFTASYHAGSVNNLIGKNAAEEKCDYFSNDKHVTPQTPPTFLVHANDDGGVAVENSILFNQALVKNKVKAEMHLYQAGGHGFGLNNKTTTDDWFERLINWMKANKFL
ncbi:alpha/beta hydrolase [Pedobacter frigoris]|uniref:Alpha/beta hydrolase n=1 Tax=Pedobacter frigoris TaxID=2571272 RepID=A0A4U1CQ45_9SPHI|nr:alpha/beta hydrolase [Pedobacter frigoris]TKC07554.1 alpha/beta hydrolase [Pedobacter frigoris]